jgi:tetratricopeptide (TPR) repeat protein
MRKAWKDNYNQLLPILTPLDSTVGLSVKPQLENAIKKASIVAEKHQNSKWLDDSYTLIGKARLYLGEYDDGVEALRYVFTNGRDEDDKNIALIWLMRAYAQKKDYSNALNVAEYLRQQPLTKEATRHFYLAKANIHQQQEEYLTAVAILEQTFPFVSKGEEKARLHFIAGQLYDRISQYALAEEHYRDVNKNNPSYDLSFFASMNSLQNQVLVNPSVDLTKVGFEKMLKDRKNNDLKDRIYYTMGLLAERRGRFPDAIGYLRKSVSVATSNTQQVPYTYLELARIHYDRLENYEMAQAYYDSALVLLPKQSLEYKTVADRKKALDEFVAQITVVRTEDSLQVLAQMNPVALDRKMDVIIEAEEDEKQQLLRKVQQDLAIMNRPVASLGTPSLSGNGRRWELYDPLLINQGRVEFRRIWGTRSLEDNWRRSSKENTSFANLTSVASSTQPANSASPTGLMPATRLTKGSEDWELRKNQLKVNIPLTDSAFSNSQKRKKKALYQLGKIYRFDLDEPKKAVESFKRVLNEFPSTVYREELYYLLYLTLEGSDAERSVWKQKLLAEYPGSTYARLVSQEQNANSGLASTTGKVSAKKAYEAVFDKYSAGKYSDALNDIESGLAMYQNDSMVDRFALLRLFIIGKLKGREAYVQAINEFIRLYSTSSLIPRVQEMLEVASQSTVRRKL